MLALTLVSRRYCHLCTQMEASLRSLVGTRPVEIHVLDVDADPELEALYDEKVPVLLHGRTEVCHYHLDLTKVRDLLRKIR